MTDFTALHHRVMDAGSPKSKGTASQMLSNAGAGAGLDSRAVADMRHVASLVHNYQERQMDLDFVRKKFQTMAIDLVKENSMLRARLSKSEKPLSSFAQIFEEYIKEHDPAEDDILKNAEYKFLKENKGKAEGC